MRKIRRFIMWVVLNAGCIACIYYGLYMDVEWCQNIFKFICWYNFILWILIFLSFKTSKKELEGNNSVPLTFSFLVGLGIAVSVAAYGWFWYAAMELISTIIQFSAYSKSSDKK